MECRNGSPAQTQERALCESGLSALSLEESFGDEASKLAHTLRYGHACQGLERDKAMVLLQGVG